MLEGKRLDLFAERLKARLDRLTSKPSLSLLEPQRLHSLSQRLEPQRLHSLSQRLESRLHHIVPKLCLLAMQRVHMIVDGGRQLVSKPRLLAIQRVEAIVNGL